MKMKMSMIKMKMLSDNRLEPVKNPLTVGDFSFHKEGNPIKATQKTLTIHNLLRCLGTTWHGPLTKALRWRDLGKG